MPEGALTFIHRFEPGAEPPILLLHGTGGDESDLVPLGRMLAPDSALLSPRGAVLENGMPRFFRRFAEGQFDEEDVVRRADDLADFVVAARERYGIGAPYALGFSNGANIAAAILLLRPDVLAGAALLRPMMPLGSPPRPDLSGRPVLMISGLADPIARPETVEPLADALSSAGARVEHTRLRTGHGLTQDDLAAVRAWLNALPAAGS